MRYESSFEQLEHGTAPLVASNPARIEIVGVNGAMTNAVKSSSSVVKDGSGGAQGPNLVRDGAAGGWLKVGAIAAGSAVLGGLAAAWFYRKALSQLREAGHAIPDSASNITENETEEDF